MNSVSIHQLETAVAQLDARLALDSQAVQLHVDRGQFMEMLGRRDEAVQAYVNALRIDPINVDALNAMGLLFMSAGNRDGARVLLRGAVLHGPTHPSAHANLAYLRMLDNDLPEARVLYEQALRLDPTLAIAHHGLADLLAQLGEESGAAQHRSLGLRYRPLTIGRFIGDATPIRVLALGTAAHGNIPTYGFFDNRVFLLASLTIEHAEPTLPLPPHDVVFNAIGEADLCVDQLTKAAAIVARTKAPVINHPAAIAVTGRAANSERLRQLQDVVTAKVISTTRAALTGPVAHVLLAAAGFTYPLLVRSPGYHTGDHFKRVDSAADLDESIADLPGDEILVIEYLNLRDRHGMFRKYRVIIVDGKLYPLHLAVSSLWKVHYFSAAMADYPANRAEDAAFLNDMHAVLGARAYAALERVRDVLGLDFGGIDFANDEHGNVVVFEANASMNVPVAGPEAIWNYRRKPVARINAAVRKMLVRRATAHVAGPCEHILV